MIDLSKLRAVFFDFDDTLAIHSKDRLLDIDKESFEWGNFLADCARCTFGGAADKLPSAYDDLERSSTMSVFIDILMRMPGKERPDIFLIGAVPNASVSECERRWILKSYSLDPKVLSTSSKVEKIPAAAAARRAANIRPEECLVVDDSLEILRLAEAAGMCSASPLEIAEFALEYVAKHPQNPIEDTLGELRKEEEDGDA